jgi:hypothetical protein
MEKVQKSSNTKYRLKLQDTSAHSVTNALLYILLSINSASNLSSFFKENCLHSLRSQADREVFHNRPFY